MKVLKYGKLDQDPSKLNESTLVRLPARNKTALTEAYNEQSFVMPRIEAIHAGRTKNFTHYPAEKLRGDASLKSGVHSWLDPYGKPVIYNHDVETDVTGRVVRAAYAEYTQAGRPGIIVVPKITEPNAVQALRDGRLLTVSIGATTDAAICSICGTDIVNEGFCGHMKGEDYDGQTAEWITGNLWFDELSWVNVPADENAIVTEIESSILMPTQESVKTEESVSKPKLETLNEYYRVPANITIVEAAQPPKADRQEAIQEMEKELEVTEEEVKVETPEVEVEVEDKKDVPAEEAPAKEEDKQDEESDPKEDDKEPTAETETDAEEDKEPEEEEVEAVKSEDIASGELEQNLNVDGTVEGTVEESTDLKAANVALEAQVAALTNELREHYKKEILSKVDMQEDAKERFAERIQERTLESLKESLSDIDEGFYSTVQTLDKPVPKREVTKIDSPIKTEESVNKKELTESDRVSFFTNMFTNK